MFVIEVVLESGLCWAIFASLNTTHASRIFPPLPDKTEETTVDCPSLLGTRLAMLAVALTAELEGYVIALWLVIELTRMR